ncbi:MAG: homocysteine S-methyltransferase family protein [Clostridiales Family XIII bacterium]|jgi:5-methyltetrahydrofolate--homocysteine methyltransferase|nr:homocysteine S-methyltransferase family protein [Clostridiales Family XIII bacterium]
MKKITDYLGQEIIVFDGAMGTSLQKATLVDDTIDKDALPETYSITHKELITGIHADYLKAGADVLTPNTFGANGLKFERPEGSALLELDVTPDPHACGYTLAEVIEAGISCAKAARDAHEIETGKHAYVALDMGPLGKLTKPVGDMSFDDAYHLAKDQVLIGADAGVDLVILETFTDIIELKASILAVKENSDLPLFCSVTFGEDGRMLLGTSPETAVYMLQDMGIDVIGINCSLGPADIVPLIARMLKVAKIPVLVQPNAGMPRLVDGATVFDIGPNEYSEHMKTMIDLGVSVVGGCCGTTPAHIERLRDVVNESVDGHDKSGDISHEHGRASSDNGSEFDICKRPPALNPNRLTHIIAKSRPTACSLTDHVVLDKNIKIIGERINPTGKKRLRQAYATDEFTYVVEEARRQADAGASIIAINAGMPEIDEGHVLLNSIDAVSTAIDNPISIDCKIPEYIDLAARYYRGKAIINSVSGERESLDTILPIAARYGCSLIVLLLDDDGIPTNVDKRIEILDTIIEEARAYGIGPDRMIVDALALTVSAEQDAVVQTLKSIEIISARGMATTLGASNISFGLPDRKLMNQTFLSMAVYAGLTNPITDPTVTEYTDALSAASVLVGVDRDADHYIEYIKERPDSVTINPNMTIGDLISAGGANAGGVGAHTTSNASKHTQKKASHPKDKFGPYIPADIEDTLTIIEATLPSEAAVLYDIIVRGSSVDAAKATADVIAVMDSVDVIDKVIVPALEVVGAKFESGDIFLPQMVRSADTVKISFDTIQAAAPEGEESNKYGKIVIATVKGDIHDIGKNIVASMLSNYGFDVIDLGKDVDPQVVVDALRDSGANLVGLSALMTTTMKNMEETIKQIKEELIIGEGRDIKISVGGAVLTPEYAEKMGADFYSKNAMEAVRVAQSVYGV